MARFVATINVPGYLPMDDDPPVFDTAAEAWQYLADERRHGEEPFLSDGEGWSDTVVEIEAMPDRDIPSSDGTGVVYGDTPGYQGEHDLGLAYCVTRVEDE